jgi:anthranilate synthase component I
MAGKTARFNGVMMETAMSLFDAISLPSERDFLKLSRGHSLVPVYRTVTADLETPVSAFLRIAAEEPEAFLLESVEGGEHVGRYRAL